jgi:hypothetical protein
MTAIASRQRSRMLAALACGVASALVLPVGVVLGARTILGSEGGSSVDGSGGPLMPVTPAALLATVDGEGEVTTLSVLVLHPSGVGGTVVMVAAGTKTEVPAGDPSVRLADAHASGGLEALAREASGVLDVSFSAAAVVKADELAALLAEVPPVPVTFDESVVNTVMQPPDPATTTTVRSRSTTTTSVEPALVPVSTQLFPAGASTLAPADVAAVLTAVRIGEPETDRLPRTARIWQAIAGAGPIGSPPADAEGRVPADVPGFLARLLAGPFQVWSLAATPVEEPGAPPGLYSLDRAEVTMIMASVAPSSLILHSESTVVVQIDSSFNNAAMTRAVVERLTAAGIPVGLIRELTGAPPVEVTTLVATDGAMLAAAEPSFAAALGPVTTKVASRRAWAEGMTVQVVLGASLEGFLAGNPPVPTTIPADPVVDE